MVLQEYLLLGRDARFPRAQSYSRHPEVSSYNAARLQECQLHQASSICEMFPRPSAGSDPPQPFPAGVSGGKVPLRSCGDGAGTPPALQAGLCQDSQEILPRRLQEQQCERHDYLESEEGGD